MHQISYTQLINTCTSYCYRGPCITIIIIVKNVMFSAQKIDQGMWWGSVDINRLKL